MSIQKAEFANYNGAKVYEYTLSNANGLSAQILNYGGIVKNLYVPDKNGNRIDVALGFDTFEDYLDNAGYYGTLVGRCANRIEKGVFSINGTEYQASINDGENSLHGGVGGFHRHLWNAEMIDAENPSLVLRTVSPDGEDGFPGNLDLTVTYTLKENGLTIRYEAISDKDTVANLTNHSYFNLNGAGVRDIKNMDLQMNCSYYTPVTKACVTTGEILSVKDTAFDFTKKRNIGEAMAEKHPQTQPFNGFDHNFAIDGTGFRKAAELSSKETGISMEIFTDMPGIQLYTGNSITEGRRYKDKKFYKIHDGICLETQFFPNAVNFMHFPSPILRAGEKYDSTTEYRFIARNE